MARRRLRLSFAEPEQRAGPRLHVQISRESDGLAVSLHGAVSGRMVTLARGLTEEEARGRAEAEASERGIPIRDVE